MGKSLLWSMVVLLALGMSAPGWAHKAKKSARVFFVNIEDGAVVESPLRLRFGAEGINIAAAGDNPHRAGHHHLLIDVAERVNMEEPIPMDARHIHFSQGETEVEIELSPGEHTLQLVLGDEEHLPWADWLVSERIRIQVRAPE